MEKIKPMLPSLKEKKRYIAFEVISQAPVGQFSSVSHAVWKSCLAFMGELGTSQAGIWLVSGKWNSKNQRGLIRVGNKSINNVKASLAMVKSIDRQAVIIRSLGVSGMLTKAYAKYVHSG